MTYRRRGSSPSTILTTVFVIGLVFDLLRLVMVITWALLAMSVRVRIVLIRVGWLAVQFPMVAMAAGGRTAARC
jgi:hypothetical protein